MSNFLCDDFLLNNSTSHELFSACSQLPIIDYHCHIDPQDIAQDRHYSNITQLWLGGDHYKWRLMRSAGVDEKYITGDVPDRDKFLKWVEVLERSIGNPLYHWSHLELLRYFGFNDCLNTNTAPEVWKLCEDCLSRSDMSARGIIERSNVAVICTTDDPVDSLEWHTVLASDRSFSTTVLPTWRPDRAVNIEKDGFIQYIHKLEAVTSHVINNFDSLKEALLLRLDFFEEHGCRVSDHGLDHMVFEPCTSAEADVIFQLALSGSKLNDLQIRMYKTAVLCFLAAEYFHRDWVMQLHYGCLRNNNPVAYSSLGADTGFDSIDDCTSSAQLVAFLGHMETISGLPKTVIYSLNPRDNAIIDTAAGCFQKGPVVSRIQHGSAWWFNDHLFGMREHLVSLASNGYLAGFIGMLTDSRCLLSYTRHEYFRRILCGLLGEWVENGLFPRDMCILRSIAEDICFYNAKRYFRF